MKKRKTKVPWAALRRELSDTIFAHRDDRSWQDVFSVSEILDESVLAKNALMSVHNATPYSAVFGRCPNLLRLFSTGQEPTMDDTS